MKRILAACLFAFSLAAASPALAENRYVFVKNECDYSIRMMARVNDGRGWKNFGWYNFPGGESSYIDSAGQHLVHDPAYTLYTFAESDALKKETSDSKPGALNTSFRGRDIVVTPHRPKIDKDGDLNITFTCSDDLGD